MTPGDASFVIHRTLQDNAIVLRLQGELDLATVPALKRALAEAEDDAQHMEVVIDLSGLSFLDASGIHALVLAHGEAETNGHSLKVVNPGRWIRRVFDLTSTAYLVQEEPDGPSGRREGSYV